jgi:galactokinase
MDANDITKYYQEHFNVQPTIVVRAPGRINVIGEHTDYNGGYVLPAAIDRAIWLAGSPRTDDQLVFHAVDLNETWTGTTAAYTSQDTHGWANYLLGVLSEARKDGLEATGLDLAFGGDIPLGAGLSSSAALESGMIFLLDALFDWKLNPMEVVRLAQRGENQFVGMQCGIMDMFASVMGRTDQVVRLDCRNLEYAYFPFQRQSHHFVLMDSGIKHQLVDSEYNTRRAECEQGVAIVQKVAPEVRTLRDVSPELLAACQADMPEVVYRRCLFVIEEIARVEAACAALEADDLALLGQLMYEGHEGLALKYEVCVPETNALVDFSRGHALGARQMGGGFGGCVIALVESATADEFCSEATDFYYDNFGITLKTWPVRLTDGVARIL